MLRTVLLLVKMPRRWGNADTVRKIQQNALPLINDYGWRKGQLPKFRARDPFHRQQLMRRMLTELIRRDYVIVGGARAPSLRAVADQAVTLAKNGDTDSRQYLAYFLQDPLMVDKAFDEFPRRFRDYHGSYTMDTPLRNRRRKDYARMHFVEFKNRAMSDSHKGEDYSKGPERFFLPPHVIEAERGIQRPPHLQMAFDRWASKYKTDEFHHWWKLRHAKMRYWGVRNVPHPSEVDPLWTEKDEEEWQSDSMQSAEAIDLESDDAKAVGEGGV